MPTPEDMYHIICEVLGEQFSLEDLNYFTEHIYRRKKIRYLERSLPLGMTGCCIPFADSDVICIQQGLNPILDRIARLHEIAHLMLGHVPSKAEELPTYADFLKKPQEYLETALNRDHSTAYDEPQEFDAETLATLLFRNIAEDSFTSALARELYAE